MKSKLNTFYIRIHFKNKSTSSSIIKSKNIKKALLHIIKYNINENDIVVNIDINNEEICNVS